MFPKANVYEYLLITFCLAIFLVGVFFSYYPNKNLSKTYSGDLRNRVVGSRVALEYKDPYFFKWQPGLSDKLIDPVQNPDHQISRVTASPTLLALLTPLVNINYNTIVDVVFLINLLLYVFLSGLLLFKVKKLENKKLAFAFLLSFAMSPIFMMMLMLGQVYLFYLFLFIFAMWLVDNKKGFLGAVIIGLLVTIRPHYIIASVIFFNRKNIKNFFVLILTSFISFGVTLFLYGADIWFKYFSAMRLQSKFHYKYFYEAVSFNNYYPEIIEGRAIRTTIQHVQYYDSSLKGILIRLLNFEISSSLLILIASGLLIFFTLNFKSSYNKVSNYVKTNLILIFILCLEILTPSARYQYHDILLLPIVFSLIYYYKKITLSQKIIIFIYFILGNFLYFFDNPAKVVFLYTFILISAILTFKESAIHK